MLNWETIITTLISSTLITSVIILIVKKTIEKSIDIKFNQIENQHKADLVEIKRREAKLFDDRYEFYKTISSLLYRVRNSHREAVKVIDINILDLSFLNKTIKTHEDYFENLEQLIYGNRILFSNVFYHELHELKKNLDISNKNLEFLLSDKCQSDKKLFLIEKIQELHIKIDKHYTTMLTIMQKEYGVKN